MVFQWKKRWIFSTHQICYLYSKKEWQTCIVEAKSILQKRYGVNTKNNKKPKRAEERSVTRRDKS